MTMYRDGESAVIEFTPARMKTASRRSGHPRTTIASVIYRALRDDIVSMRRKPGEPIQDTEITQVYGVSRTPVREALLRLSDEGLIDVFPQSGTFVSLIPVAELPEAILIRRALEEAVARYAAQKATRGQIAVLRANLEIQREKCEAEDADGFHAADEAFHALLAEVAGYPRFWVVAQQVKVQVDRFRRLTLPIPGHISEVVAEHARIVDAIEAGDLNAAAAAMTAHIGGLLPNMENARKHYPQYFADDQAGVSPGPTRASPG